MHLAEAPRFELGLGQYPTGGFQDRSLQPLGYASVRDRFWILLRAKSSAENRSSPKETKKHFANKMPICDLVPSPLVEKRSDPYHGSVLPLNYEGGKFTLCKTALLLGNVAYYRLVGRASQ